MKLFRKKNMGALFLLALVSMQVTSREARASDLQSVRLCLDSLSSVHGVEEYERVVKTCFELAKPFAESDSVSGISLYLQTLLAERGLRHDGSREFYRAIASEGQNYFVSHLQKYLGNENLRRLSEVELLDALEALDTAVFYSSLVYAEPAGLGDELRILETLTERKLATPAQATKVFQSLLGNSEWERAAGLTKSWPELGSLPRIRREEAPGPGELGYLTLSADLGTLTLKKYAPTTGPAILIYGDCHFAIEAFRELSAHPDFVKAMLRYGLVVGSPNNTDFAAIDSWRKQFPAFEIHPLYKTGAWFERGFKNTASPSFAFLRNGKIEFAFEGALDGLTEKFRTGLKKIGLPVSGVRK